MLNAQNVRASFSLVLCISLLISAGAQTAAPQGDVHIKELKFSKLVDKKLQPRQIEVVASLQTSGTAVSSLALFYRAAGTTSSRVSRGMSQKCPVPRGWI
jgi:hypothetical protein